MRHVKCFFGPLVNGKKILLVDDDAVFVRGMSTILGSEGFEVLIAEDGASTVNALRDARPDLILMDIHFLMRVLAVVMGRDVARDDHHRNGIEGRVGDACCGIRQSRSEV